MDTSIFQTKTDFRPVNNPSTDKAFIIGHDMGYSASKIVTANQVCCVPNFVREVHGEIVGELGPTEIAYLDEQGKKYYVGDLAFKAMHRGENVTESSIYGRKHYLSPEFLIQFRIGVAMALWNTKVEEKKLFIQTGLPPAYLAEDEAFLRRAIEGHHKFKVRKGNEHRSFDFTIDSRQIDVMIQPMGTLYSIGTDMNGRPTPDLARYMNEGIMIFDGGFGTLDLYIIETKTAVAKITDDTICMRRILDEARTAMLVDHPVLKTTISIPEMQECRRTGKYVYRDVLNMSMETIDVSKYIADANAKVREEGYAVVKRKLSDCNVFNIAMTGGIGAAWKTYFAENLSKVGITVIPGNALSGLPYIYSNARGYYMAAYNRLKSL